MIPGDIVFDTVINANILFIIAYALWRLARFALDHLGLKHAYATQLKLLNTVFLAILFSPFLILGATALQQSLVGQVITVNLSDMVVSHYLNGGLEMRATDFERLVSLRDSISGNVLRGENWLGIIILGRASGLFRVLPAQNRVVQLRLAQLWAGDHQAVRPHSGAVLDAWVSQVLHRHSLEHAGARRGSEGHSCA